MSFVPKRLSNDEPTVSIGVKVPLSVATQLSLRADAEGVPVSEVARQAMVRGLDVVSPGAGPKVSTEVILPARVDAVPVVEVKAPSRRAHRWVSVAKDSPVKHCERCHLTERTWRKHGGQPEVCS